MSFDIYGNHLRQGHCEVHPEVHEEYPCFVCLQENKLKNHPEPQQPEPTAEDYLVAEAIAARDKEWIEWLEVNSNTDAGWIVVNPDRWQNRKKEVK